MKSMRVDLVQQIVFKTKDQSRKSSRQVTTVKYTEKIKGYAEGNWKNSLLVPPVCSSSSNDLCKIIDISYEVKFRFKIDGTWMIMAIPREISIPIVIGTIPLIESDKLDPRILSVVYQQSGFDPTTEQKFPKNYDINGEIIQTDLRTFRPYYPYLKNLSII